MTSADPVLDDDGLNHALLARQHLDARVASTVVEEVHHLVGLQAQNPPSPYAALWSRVEGFTHTELGSALLDRTVARLAVMRGTIHLVTADDALLLPRLLAPLFLRDLRANPTYGVPLRDVDLQDLASAARDLVEAEPMTAGVLGSRLAARWPDVDPRALAHGARGTLPLVQVTPRGVWGRSGTTTWTTAESWLGRAAADLSEPGSRRAALEQLTLRYLAAFGPASVADLQYWCGLTGLGEVVASLRPRLVVHRAPPTAAGRPGRELFDLPDAPRPAADGTLPVRLLPDFDNLTIAHADRTRVITDEDRRRLFSPNGVTPGKVLVDGRVAGTWRVERSPRARGEGRTTLTVTLFSAQPAERQDAVKHEAEAFVRFWVDDVDDHRVVVRTT